MSYLETMTWIVNIIVWLKVIVKKCREVKIESFNHLHQMTHKPNNQIQKLAFLIFLVSLNICHQPWVSWLFSNFEQITLFSIYLTATENRQWWKWKKWILHVLDEHFGYCTPSISIVKRLFIFYILLWSLKHE